MSKTKKSGSLKSFSNTAFKLSIFAIIMFISLALFTGVGIAENEEVFQGTFGNGYVEVDDGDVVLTFAVGNKEKADAWFFSDNKGDSEWDNDGEYFDGKFQLDDDYEYIFQGIASEYVDENSAKGWVSDYDGGAWEAMLFEDDDEKQYALLAAGRGDDNGVLGTFEENKGNDNEPGFGLVKVDTKEHWQGSNDSFEEDPVNHDAETINKAINEGEIHEDGLELIGVGFWTNNYESYETIQDAVDEAEKGETIVVSEGTYEVDETIHIKDKEDIRLEVDGEVIITPKEDADLDSTNTLVIEDSSDITVSGFKAIEFLTTDGANAISIRESEDVLISENTFEATLDEDDDEGDWSSTGVVISGDGEAHGIDPSSDITIEENTFDIAGPNTIGLAFYGIEEGLTVEGNNFKNAGNYHVHEYTTEHIDFEPILENNDFNRAVVIRDSEIKVHTIFTSIQEAVNAAEGDTVEVYPGTYNENLTIGVDEINLTSAESKENTEIKGSVGIEADNFTLKGFHINDPSSEDAPVDIKNADGLTIKDNLVEGGSITGGISTWTGPAKAHGDILIKNNKIIDGPIGLIFGDEEASVDVLNNKIDGAGHEGIWFWQNEKANIKVEDNEVLDTEKKEEPADLKLVDKPDKLNRKEDPINISSSIFEKNNGIETINLEWDRLYDFESFAYNKDKEVFYDRIQAAINAVNEGDTIKVSEGVFEEDLIIDVNRITIKHPNDYRIRPPEYIPSYDQESALIRGDTIRIEANGVTLENFVIDNNDGQRAIGLQNSDGSTIKNNHIKNSFRAIQGDWHGRPKDVEIKGNKLETDYGIAGTEDVENLTVENNEFMTEVEGIGLGEGVELADDKEISDVLDENTWELEGGYAVKDYRDNTIYVIEETTIQEAVDKAKEGDTIVVKDGTYEESVEIEVEDLSIFGESSDNTTLEGNFVVESDGVKIAGFTIDATDKEDAIKHTGSDLTLLDNVIKNADTRALYADNPPYHIENNTFRDMPHTIGGIEGSDSEEEKHEIFDNKFENVDYAVEISSGSDGVGYIDVSRNSFIDIEEYAVYNYFDEDVDASHNYWGHPTGPGGEGTGQGANVSENVEYIPWLPVPWAQRGTEFLEISPENPTVTRGRSRTFTAEIVDEEGESVDVTGQTGWSIEDQGNWEIDENVVTTDSADSKTVRAEYSDGDVFVDETLIETTLFIAEGRTIDIGPPEELPDPISEEFVPGAASQVEGVLDALQGQVVNIDIPGAEVAEERGSAIEGISFNSNSDQTISLNIFPLSEGEVDVELPNHVDFMEMDVDGDFEETIVTFSIRTDVLEERNAGRGDVVLKRYDPENDEWQRLNTAYIDEEDGRYIFEAEVPEFSLFATAVDIVEDVEVGEPDLQVTDLEVDLPDNEAPVDSNIVLEIENFGDAEGEHEITASVMLGNIEEESYQTEVTLDEGESVVEEIEHTFTQPGDYTITAEDHSVDVEILTPEVDEPVEDEPGPAGLIVENPGSVAIGVIVILLAVGFAIYRWQSGDN